MSGCTWVVREETKNKLAEHCGRLEEAEGVAFCPKHMIMWREQQANNERRMEKARRGKERKQMMREALKDSPLKAFNPLFDEHGRRTGYEK